MKLINLLIIALSAASNPAAAVAADENNNKATVATNLLRGTFDSAFNLIMASNGIYEEEEEGCSNESIACTTHAICCGRAWECAECCDNSWNGLCGVHKDQNGNCPLPATQVCAGTAEEDVEEVEEDVADRPPARTCVALGNSCEKNAPYGSAATCCATASGGGSMACNCVASDGSDAGPAEGSHETCKCVRNDEDEFPFVAANSS